MEKDKKFKKILKWDLFYNGEKIGETIICYNCNTIIENANRCPHCGTENKMEVNTK